MEANELNSPSDSGEVLDLKKYKSQARKTEIKKFFKDPFVIVAIVGILFFLLMFTIYPLLILLKDAFLRRYGGADQTTGYQFSYIFTTLNYQSSIKHSLVIGLLVGFGATAIGFLFAYVDVYLKVKGKFMRGLFKVVSLLPLVSPPFVISIAIIVLFGNSGLITNRWWHIPMNQGLYGYPGIIAVEIITFFPTAYLMLKGLLKNIDPSLEEAARDMGASRSHVFWTVTMPLLAPGLANAFLVSFIESMADFANPMIIGGSMETMATQIYNTLMGGNGINANYQACAMSIILLAISMAFFFIQKYVFERKSYATISGKATRARMQIEDKKVVIPLEIFCSIISACVIGLYVVVILVSFWQNMDTSNIVYTLSNWHEATSGTGLASLKDTLITSLIAAPLCAILSMMIAYLIVKKKFIGRGVIEFTSMLAMAIPGTVLGLGFIRGFVKGVFHTGWMSGLYGTIWIIIIVFIVRSLPVGVRSGVAALRQIDKSIEESAYDMGANSLHVFRTVTLPLIKDSFFSSLSTSFVRSITAISAVILLCTPQIKLITYVINEFAGKGAYGIASAYATILILVAGVTIVVFDLLTGLLGKGHKIRRRKHNG
jgi:iron(III) transport system permease protein